MLPQAPLSSLNTCLISKIVLGCLKLLPKLLPLWLALVEGERRGERSEADCKRVAGCTPTYFVRQKVGPLLMI